MASDMAIVAVIVIASFSIGALYGVIAMVAAAARTEDCSTMRQPDRSLVLREEALGHVARSVRRLNGVGLRVHGPYGP